MIYNTLILHSLFKYNRMLILSAREICTMIEEYNCSFLKQKLNEGGQLIDVRSAMEFSKGAINGAVNMPIESFKLTKDDIDNTKPVLLYCLSGARSGMVKKYLDELGYDQVHNIGGIRQFITC